MVSKNLVFTISAKDGDVLRAFGRIAGAAKKDMKTAGEAVDDTRTAGQKMADAMSKIADELNVEFKGMASASAALRASLGDDFGRSDAEIRRMVESLSKSGLTFAEIEADADSLAASIRKLDAKPADDLGDGLRRVGAEADKSRSVMANFAGNAVQELPGMAGAFGPLNMAIGQFTEYATEGDIAIKGLLAASLPIAGLAVGIGVLTSQMDRAAKNAKQHRDQIDAWTKGLRDNGDAVDEMVKRWEEAGKVELQVFFDMEDITPEMRELGLTAEQVAKLLQGGEPAIQAWVGRMQEAGISGDAFNVVLAGLLGGTADFVEAQKRAALQNEIFASSIENVGVGFAKTAPGVAGASKLLADRLAVDAAKARREIEQLTASWDVLTGRLDAEQALADTADQFDALEKAAIEAYVAGVTGSKDAAEKQAVLQQTLRDTKRDLANLGKQYTDMPKSLVTSVQALIDQGSVDHARAIIDGLTRMRTVEVWFEPRLVSTRFKVVVDGGLAAGGPAGPGSVHEVVEQGPELLHMGGRSFLMMGDQGGVVEPVTAVTAPGYTGSAAGGGDTYIDVHVHGSVVTQRDLVDGLHDAFLAKQARNVTLGLS